MAQAIEQEMRNYFMQLNEDEKKTILQMVKAFVQRRSTTDPVTLEHYNAEIDDAMLRVDEGSFTTQEDLEKEMKGW